MRLWNGNCSKCTPQGRFEKGQGVKSIKIYHKVILFRRSELHHDAPPRPTKACQCSSPGSAQGPSGQLSGTSINPFSSKSESVRQKSCQNHDSVMFWVPTARLSENLHGLGKLLCLFNSAMSCVVWCRGGLYGISMLSLVVEAMLGP